MQKHVCFLLLVILSSLNCFSQQEFSDPSRTEFKDDAGQQGSKSGFFQTARPSINYPAGASGWWHLLDVRHSNGANNYAMQFAGSFYDGNLYFRKTNNNPSQPWSRVLLETNGSVGIGGSATDILSVKSIIGSNTEEVRFGGYNGRTLSAYENGQLFNFDFYAKQTFFSSDFVLDRDKTMTFNYLNKEGIATNASLLTNRDGFNFFIGGDTRMLLHPSGQVGIGTTNPSARLHVESPEGGKVLFLENGAYGSLSLNGNASDWNILSASFDRNLYLNRSSGADMYFRIGGNVNQMALKANGNFGVGTVDPEARLTVTGSSVATWDPQSNISSFNGNGFRINSTGNAYSQDGITYQSGLNGGGAAVAFGRGGSWDTYMSFYTNDHNTAGTGSIRERMRLDEYGNLGIGTTDTKGYKLAVNGTAIFTKVQVKAASTSFPDYVFKSDYKLRSLGELELYIKKYSHLPEVPSADDVQKEGLDVAATQAALLKKIEELTLYVIEQGKKNDRLEKQNEKLESQNQLLLDRLERLEKQASK